MDEKEAKRVVAALRRQECFVVDGKIHMIEQVAISEERGCQYISLRLRDHGPGLPDEYTAISREERARNLASKNLAHLIDSPIYQAREPVKSGGPLVLRLFDYGLLFSDGSMLMREEAIGMTSRLFLQNSICVDGQTHPILEVALTNIGLERKAGYVCILIDMPRAM